MATAQMVLLVISVVSGAAAAACWLRFRHIHQCSVCGSRPARLYRCEWADGRVERRCFDHVGGR